MAHTSSTKTPAWIVPVTLVALLLGFLIVFAARASRNSPSSLSPFGTESRSASPNIGPSIDEKEAEISKLREETTRLQNALADESKQSKVLNDQLQESKLIGGITKVEGPGIEVVLRDSKKKAEDLYMRDQLVIHDMDVLRTVNELWASGAEAISVNKIRVSIRSYFRCEGPVIYVGRTPIASPIVIRAIGDPDTLMGAVAMQGRFLDEIKSVDADMVEVRRLDHIELPAFTGSTDFAFAKPVLVNQ